MNKEDLHLMNGIDAKDGIGYNGEVYTKEVGTNTISASTHNASHNTTHKESKFKDGEVVNMFRDYRFRFLEYYFREGISFVKFDDLSNLIADSLTIGTHKLDVFITRGGVFRTPNEFVHDDVNIILTQSAINGIRALNKELKECFMMVYRPSQRTYIFTEIEEEKFFKLISLKDDILVDNIPEFKEASLNKAKWTKYNTLKPIIDDLLNGSTDKKVDDKTMIPLCIEAVKNGYSDKELHMIHKNHFKDRYDEIETNMQINWSKNQLKNVDFTHKSA